MQLLVAAKCRMFWTLSLAGLLSNLYLYGGTHGNTVREESRNTVAFLCFGSLDFAGMLFFFFFFAETMVTVNCESGKEMQCFMMKLRGEGRRGRAEYAVCVLELKGRCEHFPQKPLCRSDNDKVGLLYICCPFFLSQTTYTQKVHKPPGITPAPLLPLLLCSKRILLQGKSCQTMAVLSSHHPHSNVLSSGVETAVVGVDGG